MQINKESRERPRKESKVETGDYEKERKRDIEQEINEETDRDKSSLPHYLHMQINKERRERPRNEPKEETGD